LIRVALQYSGCLDTITLLRHFLKKTFCDVVSRSFYVFYSFILLKKITMLIMCNFREERSLKCAVIN
jgi:hypothetical protein